MNYTQFKSVFRKCFIEQGFTRISPSDLILASGDLAWKVSIEKQRHAPRAVITVGAAMPDRGIDFFGKQASQSPFVMSLAEFYPNTGEVDRDSAHSWRRFAFSALDYEATDDHSTETSLRTVCLQIGATLRSIDGRGELRHEINSNGWNPIIMPAMEEALFKSL